MTEPINVSARVDEVTNRRVFLQKIVVGAAAIAGTGVLLSPLAFEKKPNKNNGTANNPNDLSNEKFTDSRYKNAYLIKDEYCNSNNEAFNPLNRFNPEDFLKRFSQSEEPSQKLTTNLFDKYGTPDEFIKFIIKELTGKDTDVKIVIDDNLREEVVAKYDITHHVISIRSLQNNTGYNAEQKKLNEYGFINRLLALAHETGHAINIFGKERMDQLQKDIDDRLISTANNDPSNTVELKITRDEYSRYNEIVISDEAFASLFTISVANYLMRKHPEYSDEIRKALGEFDNSNCFYFKAYQEDNAHNHKFLKTYSTHIDDAHYNGALLAYALVDQYGNAEKAFNALILNDEITSELKNKMLEQYEIADRLSKNIVAIFRDEFNKTSKNDFNKVIELLQKFESILDYLGYKKEMQKMYLEDVAKKFGISVIENK